MGIIKIPAAGRTDTDAVAALGQPADGIDAEPGEYVVDDAENPD